MLLTIHFLFFTRTIL